MNWISVKDQPVPITPRVLAINIYGSIAVVEWFQNKYLEESWFSSGWGCSCCNGYCPFGEITHWMPLPDPPND